MGITIEESLPLARKFIDFVNKACTPFHAVDEIRKRLLSSGFKQLYETDNWKLERNGRYFFTRNQSTICAFAVGGKYTTGNGFKIVAAHTDSPDLKLKPVSAQSSQNYLQVGVQCYGGGLWHTWFDRDLTVAGRVLVEHPNENGQSTFKHTLVRVDRPILRIPTLAIHLNREVSEGFKFNNENHLLPVLSTNIQSQLGEDNKSATTKSRHHAVLLDILAKELNCKVEQIRDFELSVVDTQLSAIGGANNEFIFSPRLDNLLSCFCALEGLLEADQSVADDVDVRVIALFDNEEVGSDTAYGAGSSLMKDLIERINTLLATKDSPLDAYNTCISRSFIISADMAHAVHPNYPDKHQQNHRPEIHKGPVIKVNANQRYATTAPTSLVIQELAKRNKIPVQDFVIRNDMGCGSTIGNIMASGLGIRTVDIGNPQLSMHSIREMCGTIDLTYSACLIKAFFEQFRQLDESLKVDDQ
eukprot:GEZU01012422.1.p1 GENE.GEZU01012422.1~~GEZU01012422.1.p1  ORF type:complete len:472 (-),score=159.64 GEZU01012422.1:1025-2440(-)